MRVLYKHEQAEDGVVGIGAVDAGSSYMIGGRFGEIGLYAQYLF